MAESKGILSKVQKTLSALDIGQSARILAGVSGGIDSIVMASILLELHYPLSVAHVNFQLRGAESDSDAEFVEDWCTDNKIPFIDLSADTRQYASDHKLNTQSAAREIRYAWWNELLRSDIYDYVATGHHHDDSVETFFINLLRGTGLKGLTGIQHRRDQFIRPLIDLKKRDIELYANENNIQFRVDSSNQKDDYGRNQIRHTLIPVIEKISSKESVLHQSLRRIRIEWSSWEDAYHQWQAGSITMVRAGFLITVSPAQQAFLLRWLEEKGFPWQLSADYVLSDAGTHNVLNHNNYVLSKTKEGYFLEPAVHPTVCTIPTEGSYVVEGGKLSIMQISAEEFNITKDPLIEYISKDAVRWPLHVRSPKDGDAFQPLGMKGQTKKLQDFFVDHKLDVHEKRHTQLLESNGAILWIIGKRLDERAKVKEGEEEIYKLTFTPST